MAPAQNVCYTWSVIFSGISPPTYAYQTKLHSWQVHLQLQLHPHTYVAMHLWVHNAILNLKSTRPCIAKRLLTSHINVQRSQVPVAGDGDVDEPSQCACNFGGGTGHSVEPDNLWQPRPAGWVHKHRRFQVLLCLP